MVYVKDVTLDNIGDVFRVCSRNKLFDPLQKEGICLKEKWLNHMLTVYGTITKVAYYNEEPSAQIMYYPEEALPYIASPRGNVLLIECIYNSNPESQGKGVGTKLLEALLIESSEGLKCMNGKVPEFIVASAFNTGEGISMEKFYLSKGFKKGNNEMFYELKGKYYPRETIKFNQLDEDKNKIIVFYNRNCEYSYPFSMKIKEAIREVDGEIPVELIDVWDKPGEYAKRGENLVIANTKPVYSHIAKPEEFKREIKEALSQFS